MIVKLHEKEQEVLRLQALDRRVSMTLPTKVYVNKAYRNKIAEVKGEREVAYSLGFLNGKRFLILHNLRLSDEYGYFQIDTLILNERYIKILEVKNWYGTLLFDGNGQVIRIGDNQKEEGFPNPVTQAKMQKYRLQKWLNNQGFPIPPIDFFVVISFPSTIIKSLSPSKKTPEKVIYNNQLFFKIQELDEIYTSRVTKMEQLKRFSSYLIEAHTPPSDKILEKYNISKEELIKGVICSNCSTTPMIRKRGIWFCGNCNHTSSIAHLAALNDYKLLIGHKITNRDAREFLKIESPHVVKRLLQNAGYVVVGERKWRSYELEIK